MIVVLGLLGLVCLSSVALPVLGGLNCASLLYSLLTYPSPPSDPKLIKLFGAHQAEFARLETLLEAEQTIAGVSPYFGTCQTVDRRTLRSGADSRCDEYLALLGAIGIEYGRMSGEPAHFTVYASGLLHRGFVKGFAYAPDLTELRGVQVASTDKRPIDLPCYRHVSGDWYIFFE